MCRASVLNYEHVCDMSCQDTDIVWFKKPAAAVLLLPGRGLADRVRPLHRRPRRPEQRAQRRVRVRAFQHGDDRVLQVLVKVLNSRL